MPKKPERDDNRNRMPENVVDLTDLLRERRLQREREAREEREEEQSAEIPDFDDDDDDDDEYPVKPEKPYGEKNENRPDRSGRKENRKRPQRAGREEDSESLRRTDREEIPEEEDEEGGSLGGRPRKAVKKRVSIGTRIVDILITAFLFFLILLAAAMIAASLTPAEKIILSGREYTEEARVREYYFPDEKSMLLSRIMVRMLIGRTNPPAFSRAKYRLTGLKECTLELTEKEALFTIAASEEAGYLVITHDGAELTTLPETPEHLPFISGIAAEKSIPLFRPETDNPALYDALVEVVVRLKKNEVEPEEVYVLKDSIFLRFGAVKVCLGGGENLDGKLRELKDQVSLFNGLKGTLHLEDYSSSKENERFRFEVEP